MKYSERRQEILDSLRDLGFGELPLDKAFALADFVADREISLEKRIEDERTRMRKGETMDDWYARLGIDTTGREFATPEPANAT